MKTLRTLFAAALCLVTLTSSAATAASASTTSAATSAAVQSAHSSDSDLLINIVHEDRVLAYDTDVYTHNFFAGISVVITVEGDGDTDLDLYIYDENGNLIDSDTDDSDFCICSFTPKWTGKFKMKIVNRGGVYNRYTIRMAQ